MNQSTTYSEAIRKRIKFPHCVDVSSEICETVSMEINSSNAISECEIKDQMDTMSKDIHMDQANEKCNRNLSDDDNDDEMFPFPPDNDIGDMLEEVKYTGIFPAITERYFTPYYKINVQKALDDICILLHSNRTCMLALAPSHSILQAKRRITKIDFRVSDKLDRSMNKVSGKSKHGAQPLQANSNICVISCSGGDSYTIKCCIIGKLIEVNENLLHDPELLLQPPHKGGYLAIILPNINLLDKMKNNLLTQAQYNNVLSKRDINNSLMSNETLDNKCGELCQKNGNNCVDTTEDEKNSVKININGKSPR